MFSKQRWCKEYSAICPPSRDSLEKEQQLKPKYVQETKTFGKVSGMLPNQWHLRCARQEDSVDDDGDISISEASSSENEEEDGDDDDISITDQIPPPVLVQEDEECGGALSPWGNKCKAKQNIWRELDNKESSIHLMTVEQIHQRWAQKYPLKRFKNNFEAMKTQKRVYYQDDGVEPWKTSTTTSRAYDLLFKLFMDREKTKVHMMTVEQLMDSHDCFKPYGIEDFKGYIKDVDKRTRDLRSVIDDEEKAFRSFQIKYPRNELTNKGVPFWDVHHAKDYLEKDVNDGTAAKLKPKKLWSTRPEYQEFSLKIFTEHYYQEMRKQLAAPYWQHKRNIYALKQHQEEVESMRNEWHENISRDVQDMFGGINLDKEVDLEEETNHAASLLSMTVTELRDVLRSKGLKVSGRKADLIERIMNSAPHSEGN